MMFVHSQRDGYNSVVKTFLTEEAADKWIKSREKESKYHVITKLVSYAELEFYKTKFEEMYNKVMSGELPIPKKATQQFK